MAKEEAIEVEATVTEPLPNAMFTVELENGHKVLAHVSGKMRRHFIRILPGDRAAFGIGPASMSDMMLRNELSLDSPLNQIDFGPSYCRKFNSDPGFPS